MNGRVLKETTNFSEVQWCHVRVILLEFARSHSGWVTVDLVLEGLKSLHKLYLCNMYTHIFKNITGLSSCDQLFILNLTHKVVTCHYFHCGI